MTAHSSHSKSTSFETFGSTTGPPGPMIEPTGFMKNSAISSSLV
jgi:hypothetical protein